MSHDLNSNELNERMLDACLDPACFQILQAYVSLGGWKAEREVYLPMKYQKRWNISKTALKRHRPHLIDAGWLVKSGNKSELMHDKYFVRVPPAQIDPTAGADCPFPGLIPHLPPALIDPGVGSDCPINVMNNNEEHNQATNEPVTSPAADAPGQTENTSTGEGIQEDLYPSPFARTDTEDPAVPLADAPFPSSSSRPRSTDSLAQRMVINPHPSKESVKWQWGAGRPSQSEEEEKARNSVEMFRRMGSQLQLTRDEECEAVALILDPSFERKTTGTDKRAVVARRAVLNSRETDW